MWTESWTFTWHHGSEWLFKRQCFLFTYVVMLACFLRFPGFVLLPQCGLFLEFSVYVAQFWFYFQYFLSVGTLAGHFSSVQLLSRVAFCDPMNCSTPGLPVHHQLLEPTQTHVHWVGDAIQPSHPLSSSCLHSFPASRSFPRSQFFASGGQSIGVSTSALLLPTNIQDWSPLGLTGLISL